MEPLACVGEGWRGGKGARWRSEAVDGAKHGYIELGLGVGAVIMTLPVY